VVGLRQPFPSTAPTLPIGAKVPGWIGGMLGRPVAFTKMSAWASPYGNSE